MQKENDIQINGYELNRRTTSSSKGNKWNDNFRIGKIVDKNGTVRLAVAVLKSAISDYLDLPKDSAERISAMRFFETEEGLWQFYVHIAPEMIRDVERVRKMVLKECLDDAIEKLNQDRKIVDKALKIMRNKWKREIYYGKDDVQQQTGMA